MSQCYVLTILRIFGLLPVKIRNRKFCSSLRWFIWSFIVLCTILSTTAYRIHLQSFYNTQGTSIIYKQLGFILTYVRFGIILTIIWTSLGSGNRKRQIALLNSMFNFSYSKSAEGRKDKGIDIILMTNIPVLGLILTETLVFNNFLGQTSIFELENYILQMTVSIILSLQRAKICLHIKLIKKELTRILQQIQQKTHLAKQDIDLISKKYDGVLRVCYLFDKMFRPYILFMYLLIFFNYVSTYKGIKDLFKHAIQESDVKKIMSKFFTIIYYMYYQPVLFWVIYTGEHNERKVSLILIEKNS